MGHSYIAIVKYILLVGADPWVMNSCIGRLLGLFQNRVVQWVLEKNKCCLEDRTWK